MILTQITQQFSLSDFRPSNTMINRGIRVVERFYGDIYKEGERLNELFFLIEGKVSLFKKDERGRRVELPPVEGGKFLGLQALQSTSASSHSAKVRQSSKLLVIPLIQLPDFMKKWPALKELFVLQLINQIDLLEV